MVQHADIDHTGLPGVGGGGSTAGVPILRHVYQRSSGDYTTTSATLVVIDGTANTMSYDATVAANSRIKVEFMGSFTHSATTVISLNIGLDAAMQLGTSGMGLQIATSDMRNGSFVWISPQLAADTYTVAMYWHRGASGTATLRGDAARFAMFAVYEIPA